MAEDPIPTAAQLSALTNAVDQLVERVAAGALASDRTTTAGLAAALFDAERALRSARRALDRAARTLG